MEAELPSILDRGPYNLQFLANDLADFMPNDGHLQEPVVEARLHQATVS